MTRPLHILVCGAEPGTSDTNEQLWQLARACHLRADAIVWTSWGHSGTHLQRWDQCTNRLMVLDDLRTWEPVATLARVSPYAAGKLRGLRAKILMRRPPRIDVAVLDQGSGRGLLSHLRSKPKLVITATTDSSSDARVTSAERRGVDVSIKGLAFHGLTSGKAVAALPRMYEGSWVRSYALPDARAETKVELGIGTHLLIVVIMESDEPHPRVSPGEYPSSLDLDGHGNHLEWIHSNREALVDSSLTDFETRLLSASDFVVFAGVGEDNETRAIAETVGTVTIDVESFDSTAVSRSVMDRFDLRDGRPSRIEEARLRLDPSGVAQQFMDIVQGVNTKSEMMT